MAKGTSTKWNEHHSVQYARGDDASAAGEATEQIEPANHHHGHTGYTDQCGLVSNESRVSEDGLHHSGPNKCQGPKSQIDQAVHCRVFLCDRLIERPLKKILHK